MTKRPNIIWIMAEDMGLDLECYGMPGVKTPHLNQMAQEGRLYGNCYCTNPICSPSRSAMMVGAHQNSISAHNHRSNRDRPLDAPYRPFTALLREAGYTCVLGHPDVQFGGRNTDCNFRHEKVGEYDGVENFGLFDKFDEAVPADAPFFQQIQLNVTHRGDWWESVRAQSPKPVDPAAVRIPSYLPDTEVSRLDFAAYLDTVEYMDREVGMLFDDLRDKGLAENTVVFFIADNGRCQVRAKGYLYEPGLHIPCIAWAPGLVEGASFAHELVSTLDITATILTLAGAEVPEYIEGRPLFGAAGPGGGAATGEWRPVVGASVGREAPSEATSKVPAAPPPSRGAADPIYGGTDPATFAPGGDHTRERSGTAIGREGAADAFPGRRYIYGARDYFDEVDDCMRSVCDGRYNFIKNYRPEVPYDAHLAYYDFYRPIIHEMRRLHGEGRLEASADGFLAETKPELELYDWLTDPDEVHNLANDPAYAGALARMKSLLEEYQKTHRDSGLEDFGKRPAAKPASVDVRDWLRDEHPKEWERVTHEVFVKFTALRERYAAETGRGLPGQKGV